VRADGLRRRRLVGLVVLCLASYGAIAVGRANLCVDFQRPLTVCAMEKPYHYVGSLPLVIVLCMVLDQAGRLPGLRRVPAPVLLSACVLAGLAGYRRSGWRIDQRPQVRAWVEGAVAAIEAAAGRTDEGRDVVIPNAAAPPYVLGPMLDAYRFPGWAGVYAVAFPSNTLGGHRVRFVERDRQLVAHFQAPGNRRVGELLIAPPVHQSLAPPPSPDVRQGRR
jgi:hypothetical protein